MPRLFSPGRRLQEDFIAPFQYFKRAYIEETDFLHGQIVMDKGE